ncbi:efflux RND transporter permease subunit [Phenylobacterium sp.]|uniref:efflux RND transporter permease subunit n=1 Tax=Phenylobacterium sp. TaxID=1871053 RepID=UPI002F3E8CBF
MLGRIVRWSLERPRLIAWACLWFLVWGLLSARSVGFDLMPDLAPAETTIQTEASGLVAQQVENQVTRPIESALIGATNVADVHSESVQGLSIVTVRFADGADPNSARQALSERLSTLAGALPDGVAPRIAPLTSRGADVLKIGFTSDKLDPMALRDIVQWTVRPRLLTAAGVARVAVYGGQVRRIDVRARPGDLSTSDLGFLDILRAVKRATSAAGAGFIDTEGQRVLIEPHGQALTVEDVGAGQIQAPGSAPVRINDVADVVEAPAPADGDALIMGKPGVLVAVGRQYGANTLETTHAVERALAELQPALAAQGISVRTDLDRPATFATAAGRGIAADLAIGAALIAIVLAIFMRDARAVLISMISIPLSLLAAVLVLKLFGWTLNAMTLGGLAVALGVVIDDAVIGVENVITRLRDAEHDHASDLEAVLAASLEVRGPVIYATLAVIVVLAPLLALKGQGGALLGPLAGAIIAASLASLLVAAVVTPAWCLLFHQHEGPPPEPGVLRRLKDFHGDLLTRLCARPALLVTGAGILVALSLAALLVLRPEVLPSVHDGHLVVQISEPPSTSIAVTRDYGERVTAALRPLSGVRSISQRIGRDATGEDSWGPERSIFDLELAPGLGAGEQRRLADEVLRRLQRFPGLGARVQSRFDAGQDGLQPSAPVEVRVFGQDLNALDATAERIAALMKALPGAKGVTIENQERAPTVRVDIQFQRLALYGLSAGDVLDTIQAAFAGQRVAQIYVDGRVVDLAVSAQASLRRDPEAVGDLLLRSTSGVSVPLKSVANVYLSDDRAVIAHDGGLRRQVISASPADAERFASHVRQAVASKVALPRGAFVEFGGAGQAVPDARNALLLNYALALFGVIALLTVAFDGRTGALILISSLFAFTGAVAAVALMGGVMSVGALVGFIALFGLSMRSAILIFSRLEDLVLSRQQPWSLPTIVLASRERLTPLLMTALLVGLGVAPLAVHADAAGREILGPMAIVILGGLVTGTIGSLLVLPVMIFAFWRPGYARLARRHGGPAVGV